MHQFGTKKHNIAYIDRPGAHAIIFNDAGLLLAVKYRGKYYLPGGGVDGVESLHDALHREMKEEVGWSIDIGREIGSAAEYVYTSDDNKAYNKIGHFFVCSVIDNSGSRSELDHEPVWVTVKEFAGNAAHESHVWAVERYYKDF